MSGRLQRMARGQFKGVFKKSVAIHSQHFLVRLATVDENNSHWAVVVSKHVEKSALKRHLLKRRVYEVLRKILINLPQPLAIIIFAKKGASQLVYEDIEEELTQAISTN